MWKYFFFAVFAAFVLFNGNAVSAAGTEEITFIASLNELNVALKNHAIKGIAVRSEFYNQSDSANKEKIDLLVSEHANRLVPIFTYGYDIDINILKKWFSGRGQFNCQPMVMAGMFLSIYIPNGIVDISVDPAVEMCAPSDIVDGSETWFREWILTEWLQIKKELKDAGYATLN